MESTRPKRRFPPPWRAERDEHGYAVRDANGVVIARVYSRDDLHAARRDNYISHLTSDEARRIAKAIVRLPELLKTGATFPVRGTGRRWRASHPYHVALDDGYLQQNWDAVDACCRFNQVPFDRVESIERSGARFVVYEFAQQRDAIRFWDKFNGRWMRGEGFIYPTRPADLKEMESLKGKGAM